MDRLMQRLALFSAVALGFAANMASASDIHVDALGEAARPDGSAAAPFTTLKDAVTEANGLAGAFRFCIFRSSVNGCLSLFITYAGMPLLP